MKHLHFTPFFLKKIMYAFLGVFSPRSGLIAASIELQRAIADARQKYYKTGHRFYCIWDAKQRHLVTLTYNGYPGRTDSYQYMRHRGGFPPCSLSKFKESAYYYTPSKNGAKAMTEEDTRLHLQLLRARYFSRTKWPAKQ